MDFRGKKWFFGQNASKNQSKTWKRQVFAVFDHFITQKDQFSAANLRNSNKTSESSTWKKLALERFPNKSTANLLKNMEWSAYPTKSCQFAT